MSEYLPYIIASACAAIAVVPVLAFWLGYREGVKTAKYIASYIRGEDPFEKPIGGDSVASQEYTE